MPSFVGLGIHDKINAQLMANGITEPTPVQEKAIPVLLSGKDAIVQAQTGTGKTLAFLLPILERIDPLQPHLQALIVTPTRELALQITTEAKKLCSQLDDVHVLAVYGGQDVERQMNKLQGKRQIVIATPGRLLDHLRRGTVQLAQVSMLVLDEADQMLHFGFLPEVEEILRSTPPDRQMMLFSATLPPPIRTLAKSFMRKPEDVRVQGEQITVKAIKQIVVETTDRTKQATLRRLIEQYRPFLAIIFCRTKRRASKLYEALRAEGYRVDELHGDLSQAKREQVMQHFREAKIQLLVATDVAARGLDVEGVTHVFNYDIPHDVESYIHRIGRTGRAGEAGLAITLVAAKDRSELEKIEKGINLSLEKRRIDLQADSPRQDQRKQAVRTSEPSRNSSGSRQSTNGRSAGTADGKDRQRAGRQDKQSKSRTGQDGRQRNGRKTALSGAAGKNRHTGSKKNKPAGPAGFSARAGRNRNRKR